MKYIWDSNSIFAGWSDPVLGSMQTLPNTCSPRCMLRRAFVAPGTPVPLQTKLLRKIVAAWQCIPAVGEELDRVAWGKLCVQNTQLQVPAQYYQTSLAHEWGNIWSLCGLPFWKDKSEMLGVLSLSWLESHEDRHTSVFLYSLAAY